MAVFKCKMCGGALEVGEGLTVCECEYCGSKQTVPAGNDEKIAKLFERANRLRFNNEFDKAYSVYETIIGEDPEAAEAYWGLVLCKYGVEYVDDPATFDKVPTCHRSSFESVMDDENFEQVMETADTAARVVYREQAKQIEDIRKGIIEVSGKEKPYDIFICYKETAEDGQRTIDSVLAQDVYDALTDKGYRVFFSRITLEDKLGTEYEPYIFAALNSAKVMLAFGTSYDNYNAVWVKNEWQRYLKLMEKDKEKHLIPCYKDIDAYDLPKEFARLQAQDMGKVGAIQDLLRGIEKIVPLKKEKKFSNESVDMPSNRSNADGYIERAYLLIEDKNYQKADECLEDALNISPKDVRIYIAKILIERKLTSISELSECYEPLHESEYFEKAVRFADEELASKLKSFDEGIVSRNKARETENLYAEAVAIMESANSEEEYKDAETKFREIPNYQDSNVLAENCKELAEEHRKEALYCEAVYALNEAQDLTMGNTKKRIEDLEQAEKIFESIAEYKDSDAKYAACRTLMKELEEKRDNEKRKRKTILIVIIAVAVVILVACIVYSKVISPSLKYNNAVEAQANGDYITAYAIFKELGDYKDAATLKESTGLSAAEAMIENEEYDAASEVLDELEKSDKKKELRNAVYLKLAQKYYDESKYKEAADAYASIYNSDKTSDLYYDICYEFGKQLLEEGEYSEAVSRFEACSEKYDVSDWKNEAMYHYVDVNQNSSETQSKTSRFYKYIKKLKKINYADSVDIYNEVYAWKVDIVVNDDENDETTDMDSISKYNNWYFHVSLSGGAPEASTKVKYKGNFPDGDVSSGAWDGKWEDGYSGTCWFYYNSPEYGKQGTFTLKVYDSNGNKIGEKSVKITA